MMNLIFCILIIFVITFAGGYIRLCLFGSFSFKEATVLIISMDLGLGATIAVFKIFNLKDDYMWGSSLLVMLIFAIVGELIYNKKMKERKDGSNS